MTAPDRIPPDALRQLLRYEPDTGKLFWKERGPEWFTNQRACSTWNAKYAGKQAMTCQRIGGYFEGAILAQGYLAHRVIWALQTGEWPCGPMDHVDGDGSNNRWANLRLATIAQNNVNTRSRVGSTSSFRGVSWDKRAKKWVAKLQKNGRTLLCSYFTSERAAAVAYDAAAKLHHGAYARLNFSEAS